MASKWTVIAISGCTNSGKTSLSTALLLRFPGSRVLQQDLYFRPDDDPEHVAVPGLDHKNYDTLNSLKWDDLTRDLESVLTVAPSAGEALLIVDGHLVLNHVVLRGMFDRKYFLTLPVKECRVRRDARTYDPPDVPGYFELCVWPMYEKYLAEVQEECKDVVFVDGTNRQEDVLDAVERDIRLFLKTVG